MATDDNFGLIRGDTYRRRIQIFDTDGDPYNFNDAVVWLTIKRRTDHRDDDDNALVALYWASGGGSSGLTVDDPTDGWVRVTVSAAQTGALDAGQTYRYDVQILKSGEVDTPKSGLITVRADVTRRLVTP